MTTTTATNQEPKAVTATERVRARNVVLHHARDDADATDLLDMLGLADDQQDSTTLRGRGGLTGRPPGGVHALSAATEARLASTGCSANNVPPVAPAAKPAAEQAVAAPTARTDPTVERRCEGCEAPVVPQTRYRLDPDGYRQRGIKLLAAKGRCHTCYKGLRRPPSAEEVVNPSGCGEESTDAATPVDDHELNQPREQHAATMATQPTELDQAHTELADLRAKLTDATKLIGDLRADYDLATRDAQKLADQLEELSRERDQLAEQLRAATAYHCTWEWPGHDQPVKDCEERGRLYPRNRPPFETEEVRPDWKPWSELFDRIRDQLSKLDPLGAAA